MSIQRRTILQAGVAATAAGLPWRPARPQSANTIKIGVLTDMSGPYRDINGPVSVACTRLAAQEFGTRGFETEVLVADHQNRPDVALNIARQWYDRDGVDAVVNLAASSVALAVADLTREKNKVALATSPATSDPALFTKAGENWRQFPDFPLLATEELNHLPRHMRHPLGETPSTQPIG